MYKIVEKSQGIRKSFSITCGLQKGYDRDAIIRPPHEASKVILDWMQERAASGKAFLPGKMLNGVVLYAWPEGEGKAGTAQESMIEFSGELNPLYTDTMTDTTAKEILNDLATTLGRNFEQTRIYVTYKDEVWILQEETEVTPTGETA